MAGSEDEPTVANTPRKDGKRSVDPDATVPATRQRVHWEDDDEDDDTDDEATQAIIAGVVKERGKAGGSSRIQIQAGDGRGGPQIKFPADTASQPVCAVLVIIKGPGQGMCIPLSYGRSSVGRGKDARVQVDIGDKTLSSLQFIVIYDDDDHSFDLREADTASSSTYVDGARVKTSAALKTGSVIRAGSTEFRFIPCVGQDWNWSEVLGGRS